MHAHLSSARLAPKKANIMAKMVRGLPVPTAVEMLRKTHKKSARLFEGVLRSAIANAEHNFKQDPQTMILKTVVVNQGTAYRRGIPMARGRTRPIRKFLCHITITLGYPGMDKKAMKAAKAEKKAAAPKAEAKTVTAPKAATKPKTATKKSTSSSSSK